MMSGACTLWKYKVNVWAYIEEIKEILRQCLGLSWNRGLIIIVFFCDLTTEKHLENNSNAQN